MKPGKYFVIDTHCHLDEYYNFYACKPDLGSMVKTMDVLGIDKSCIAPCLALYPDYKLGNKAMSDAVKKYKGRIYGYIVINPHYPDEIEGEIKKYINQKNVIGIKIHPDCHDYPANGDNYKRMWELANEKKFVILIHTWENANSSPLFFEKISEDYPELNILLGHMGGTLKGNLQAIKVAKARKNVFLEITASEPPFWMDELLKLISADKVIFGTDSPFIGPESCYGRVAYSNISEEAKRKIFGLNFLKLIKK